jgi:hypothetical protein
MASAHGDPERDMTYFASGEELQAELEAFLGAFLASEEGARATEQARALGDRATLVLRTVEPDAAVAVDFLARRVLPGAEEDGDVEIEVEADALHDVLLERLGPVQISQLYETERLTFRGSAQHLAGLIALAGPLAPSYRASLERRGRDDLLATPAPATKVEWGSPEEARSPKRVIGHRRPWQRPKRTAEAV